MILRDFIILRLLLVSAQRPGAVANLTMEEFSKGKWDEENDLFVTGTIKHKTPSLGPASLLGSDDLQAWPNLPPEVPPILHDQVNKVSRFAGVQVQGRAIFHHERWQFPGFKQGIHQTGGDVNHSPPIAEGKNVWEANPEVRCNQLPAAAERGYKQYINERPRPTRLTQMPRQRGFTTCPTSQNRWHASQL